MNNCERDIEGRAPTEVPTGILYCAGVALTALCAGFAPMASAEGSAIEVVYSFSGGADGKFPEEALIEHDGVLYGTTADDATNNECGTVFGLTPAGEKTFTYAQILANGCRAKTLAAGADGDLYGVTEASGGAGASGTAFRITTDGEFTRLHGFSATAANGPRAGLIAGSDGSFYGTTSSGSNGVPASATGSVFRMTPLGGDAVDVAHLHDFAIGQPGLSPRTALIEDRDTDGVFYGTTSSFGGCGAGTCGTVFAITSDGAYELLHAFANPFEFPDGALVQGPDGLLYGLIALGGQFGQGAIFRLATDGTGYEIVHSFSAVADGLGAPSGSLTVADDGDLYGVAQGIFRLSTSGELTTLVSTSELMDVFGASDAALGGAAAASLTGSLVQGSDGHLYGTSRAGGTGSCTGVGSAVVIGCGTVFRVVTDDGNDGNDGGNGGSGGGSGSPVSGGSSGGGGGVAAPGAIALLLGLLGLYGWRRRGSMH